MIVLDASVLIAHLDEADALHSRAERLLDECDDDLVASTVTLAEVLVSPARAGAEDRAWAALGRMGVAEMALPVDASLRLARLRATVAVPLPDCCVLLAAQDRGASIGTFDDRLGRACRDLGLTLLS